MKKMLTLFVLFAFVTAGFGATHVFWYQGKQYLSGAKKISDNPGPDLQNIDSANIHEGMIASLMFRLQNHTQEPTFVFGGGLAAGDQGRCAAFWSRDLCNASGTAISARVRAEFRDGWSDDAFCNAGAVHIRCGVVDFQGNLESHGGADRVPENATWADGLHPISFTMGYGDDFPDSLKAEQIVHFTAPAGRGGDGDDSKLDKQFFEIDITPQVNWILSHTGSQKGNLSGQYAVVFLVDPGDTSNRGKVNSYSAENRVLSMGSDAPWTADGNTFHLVVESADLAVISAEKTPAASPQGVALLTNRPNPFQKTTSLAFSTGGAKSGRLTIHAPDGRLVHTARVSGRGCLTWDASRVAPGLYVCRLAAGSRFVSTVLMHLE